MRPVNSCRRRPRRTPSQQSPAEAERETNVVSCYSKDNLLLWPDGNKVKPLIQVLTDDWLEDPHDLLRELPAGFPIFEGAAFIGYRRQDVRRISVTHSRQVNRQ